MDDFDIGWLAGIIEGEGCITSVPEKRVLSIRVSMTDEDTIRTLHAKTGCGTVYGPYNYEHSKSVKDKWDWTVGKRDEVADLLYMIFPLMQSRRSTKIVEALENIERSRDTEAYKLKHFRCGHPKTPEYSSKEEKPHCSPCKSRKQRETRARKREGA